MPNVVLIPGTLGSELGDAAFRPFRGRRIWIDPFELALGSLFRLQLASDGHSAGPLAQGARIEVDGPIRAIYGPLELFLSSAGYTVRTFGYDWRQSLLTAATRLVQYISANFGQSQIYIVAHSLGGLVARAAWKILNQTGQSSKILRIITLGTPHYGSWEINQLFGRLDFTYWYMGGYSAFPARGNLRTSLQWVDATITSWPGLYELLPFRRSGPLASNPQAGAYLYTASNYAAYSPLVSQSWLDAADSTQQFLADAIAPAGRQVSVVGVGTNTPNGLTGDAPLYQVDGYDYTENGDGKVSVDYATLAGVPRLFARASHSILPLLPIIWSALLQIIPNGLAADWHL